VTDQAFKETLFKSPVLKAAEHVKLLAGTCAVRLFGFKESFKRRIVQRRKFVDLSAAGMVTVATSLVSATTRNAPVSHTAFTLP
jgi:hypothetical protein